VRIGALFSRVKQAEA